MVIWPNIGLAHPSRRLHCFKRAVYRWRGRRTGGGRESVGQGWSPGGWVWIDVKHEER